MTIELLAAAPDGWGLFRSPEGYWLLRPPFRVEHRFRITESQMARALWEEGFDPAAARFQDWGSAVRFLEAHVVSSASPEDVERAREAAFRLLGRATVEQATRHVERLTQEVDAGRGLSAMKALHALLGSPHVVSSPELVQRIAGLLHRASSAEFALRRGSAAQECWVVRDEAAVQQLAAKISMRGSVLTPAA